MKYMHIFLLIICIIFAKSETQPNNTAEFLEKVTLEDASIMHFFKCYNSSFYVKRFLPTCFLHMTDLYFPYLENQKDPYTYTYSVISLFLTRFKACTWTNSFALAQLLEQLSQKLSPIFKKQFNEETLTQDIDNNITALLPLIDKNRTQFVQDLKQAVYDQVRISYAVKDTQLILVRFLETVLDRLIWNPEDDMYVWKSFCIIGQQLETLHQNGIIPDHDTLNQILRSLVERFCYFIELCGASLKPQWYLDIHKELKAVSFLQYAEQEQAMKTKMQIIAHSLKCGLARAKAYNQHGIVT